MKVPFKKFAAAAVVGQVLAPPGGIAANLTTTVRADRTGETSSGVMPLPRVSADVRTSGAVLDVSVRTSNEWNDEMEIELDDLITKYALESLTGEECRRMEWLQILKGRKVCPQTFEEFERDMETTAAIEQAIESLERLAETFTKGR